MGKLMIMCNGYAQVFWLPTFWSGEWSYDLVDSLMLHNTLKLV
jgi:hypothetical protein